MTKKPSIKVGISTCRMRSKAFKILSPRKRSRSCKHLASICTASDKRSCGVRSKNFGLLSTHQYTMDPSPRNNWMLFQSWVTVKKMWSGILRMGTKLTFVSRLFLLTIPSPKKKPTSLQASVTALIVSSRMLNTDRNLISVTWLLLLRIPLPKKKLTNLQSSVTALTLSSLMLKPDMNLISVIWSSLWIIPLPKMSWTS